MPARELDWKIRSYVYACLVSSGHAPAAHHIAAHFGICGEEAAGSLRLLHEAHALVLDEFGDVLMAHPLSAVVTDYRACVDGRWLYANCAWDSLGIPAMLARDADIEARHPLTREILRYAVRDGQLRGGVGWLAHFPLPFRRWYDDIVDT